MIELSEKELQIIQAIFKEMLPGVPIWVFGSRVNGTKKPYSDLDLVIVGAEKIDQKLYYKIQDKLEESELSFRVDVLDWHRISAEFKNIIQKNYLILPTT